MVETLIFSVPAVLLGLLMGTILGISISRAKSRATDEKTTEQAALIEQQAKQIWMQADRIHTLEIEKLQMNSWRRPEDQTLYDRFADRDSERTQAVA
jgi:hypothetical protein